MTLFFTLLEELFVQIAYKLIDLNLWLLVFSSSSIVLPKLTQANQVNKMNLNPQAFSSEL